MKILVVIPTLNAQHYIEKQLQMLKKQTLKVDIFIIDSSSDDSTIEIIKKNNIKYEIIDKKEFNHGLTRNKALYFKDYDYYLFMTQDAIPLNEYLVEKLVNSFIDEVVIAYARQIPYENADLIEKLNRNINYPEKSIIKSKKDIETLGIKTFFTSNSCCMYDAKYFREKNGFVKTNTSEDMEFATRAILDNKKIAYVADALVYHSHTYTLKSIYKRYYEIGKFFAKNRWILDMVNIQKEGNSFIKKTFIYLLKHNPILIPKFILYNAVKYIAYKKGLK